MEHAVCQISHRGKVYNQYTTMAKIMELTNYKSLYEMDQINTNDIFKIIVVKNHLYFGNILYGIENVKTGEQYIIDATGVEGVLS